MTWREYTTLLEDIAARWGRLGILPEASQKQYFADLQDLSLELGLGAVEAFYRRNEKFPPNGWQIRSAALELDAIAHVPVVPQPSPQLDQAWAAIRSQLEQRLPQDVLETWLGDLQPLALDAPTLYLEAPGHTSEWIRRRFATHIVHAAGEANAGIRHVQIVSSSA